jgi:hypothetical protein
MTRALTMSEAFANYCKLYVPDVGSLDVREFAQLKGAFTTGLSMGMMLSATPGEAALRQIEQWQAEIEAFWAAPQTPAEDT